MLVLGFVVVFRVRGGGGRSAGWARNVLRPERFEIRNVLRRRTFSDRNVLRRGTF